MSMSTTGKHPDTANLRETLPLSNSIKIKLLSNVSFRDLYLFQKFHENLMVSV